LVVNAYSRTGDFEKNKQSLRELATRITGLGDGKNELVRSTTPISVDENEQNMPRPESVGSKLRELDKLYKDGVINKQDYEAKKAELLKQL
jgi:hypothetical protein